MSQIKAKRGGADSALLIAVVSESARSGRQYRIAGADHCPHEKIVSRLKYLSTSGIDAPTDRVNPDRPSPNARGLSAVTRYGMAEFQDIYSPRQALALLTIRNLVSEATAKVEPEFRLALGTCLSLAFGRLIDRNSTLCRWIPQTGAVGYTFGRQALSMIWDYAEINPLTHSGGWTGAYKGISETIENHLCLSSPGQAEQFSATEHGLANDIVAAFITDPPYYDAIPYADLSDFFYVWLRPLLQELFPRLARSNTTPKEQEAIWNPSRILQDGRPKDREFYEKQMRKALSEGRRITAPTGVGMVVFAHKSTSGWEALLNGMMEAGWVVQASWPIDTERESRTNAIGTASLASSVHLVCRPREDEDGNVIERVGDWRDVLSELPGRIADWLPRLASEGVVGADAIFACLGPALEIFSRYSSVEKASGEVVPLREYLEQVWAEVARQALNMIFEGAEASGFEEDARLTAMWLWTLRTDANGNGVDNDKTTSLPGYTLEYDAARKIAQGLGCHLENLTHLVEIKGDKAILLSAESRARYLFGKEELSATAKRRQKKDVPVQQSLFSFIGLSDEEETAAERAELERPPAGKTTLDQLHQAMLLFTAGRGAALKRFLVDDGIGTNPQFWTLAQAFSALYPSHTNEKRWVDGVLARKKGLGL